MPSAQIRCYAELSDFLPASQRGRPFPHPFNVPGSVKDALESHGVPHPEIDLILINGEPVGFERILAPGDRVAAFPRFRRLDIAAISPVHVPPLAEPRFVLDEHLGRLAHHLRLLGFAAAHEARADDESLAAAARERILLTRDLDLLKRRAVRRGYRVRSTDPRAQLAEVVRHFQLGGRFTPFTRCLVCGEPLVPATASEVAGQIPAQVASRYSAYQRCPGCRRVYWPGSHHRRLSALVDWARTVAGEDRP